VFAEATETDLNQPLVRSQFAEQYHYIADEVPIRDVTSSLATATVDFTRYREVGSVPAIKTDDGIIPMSVSSFAGNTLGREGYLHSSYIDPSRMGDTMSRWADESPTRTILRFADAQVQMFTHLTDYLGVRIAGMRHWVAQKIDGRVGIASPAMGDEADQPTNSPTGEGLFPVKVSCKKEHCRIFVSRAYFVDWIFFGYPSTPVKGHLMSGRYIFGTDAIQPKVFEDSGVFRIPDNYTPELERF
jgi:hypothetical protein